MPLSTTYPDLTLHGDILGAISEVEDLLEILDVLCRVVADIDTGERDVDVRWLAENTSEIEDLGQWLAKKGAEWSALVDGLSAP